MKVRRHSTRKQRENSAQPEAFSLNYAEWPACVETQRPTSFTISQIVAVFREKHSKVLRYPTLQGTSSSSNSLNGFLLRCSSLDAPRPPPPGHGTGTGAGWTKMDYVDGEENPFATFRFGYRSLGKQPVMFTHDEMLTPLSQIHLSILISFRKTGSL
jgi:hypothetical protein